MPAASILNRNSALAGLAACALALASGLASALSATGALACGVAGLVMAWRARRPLPTPVRVGTGILLFAAALPAPRQAASLGEAVLLGIAGLGVLGLGRLRRPFSGTTSWAGATVVAFSLPAGILVLAGHDAPAGLGLAGAVTLLALGLGLLLAAPTAALLPDPTVRPGPRSLVAAFILGALSLAAQVAALVHTAPGHYLPLLGIATGLLAIAAAVDHGVRRVWADRAAVRAVEAERERLLARLQHEAARLQEVVASRTQELAIALERSKRFDYLARTTTNGIVITDTEGRIEWVNAAWEFFTGYSLAEVRGRTPESFLHGPATDPAAAGQIAEAARTGQPVKVEILNYRKDGGQLWIVLEIQPIYDDVGRLTHFISIQGDFTAHKRRDDEQRHLNERLTLAIHALDCGVWDYDVLQDRLEWSRRQCEIYGVTPAAFTGRIEAFAALVHPDDIAAVRAAPEHASGGGTLMEYEFRIIRPDGNVRHIKAHASLWRNPEGRIVRMVGLDRDVTGAVEMREQLRLAEQRWQLALAGTNDGVWDADLVTGRTFYDDRWAEMIGCTSAELAAEADAWASRVHPDDLPAARAALQAHLDGRTPDYVCEHRLRHVDGHWVWVLDRGRVVARDAQGRPLRITGTHVDISTRKALEEQLRQSEVMSLQLSRLANIGAWEYSFANQRLTWAPEVFRIHEVELGYVPNYERALEFFPPPARRQLEEAIHRAGRAGTPFDLELPFITARGHNLWVRIQARCHGQPGPQARLYGAFQDITARREAEDMRRHLEAQLFQAQKMETLGTMAGGIAHDFNNLLTGIIGYHDLALDTLTADHEARLYLTSAREASMRARELVDQILTFSRQAGSEMVPTDLAQVVEDARRFLRATVPATIHLEVDIAPDCEPVLADVTQLHQVLLNLCSNSVHALPAAGGVIRMALDPIRLDAASDQSGHRLPPGRYLRLTFSDTGHGMDDETRERIFDPFFTTKEVGQGTGLGLSVVHGIIQAHQGAISVASTPGVGTTFTILLPVAEAHDDAGEVDDRQVPRGSGQHIAVVDDEEIIRSFVQMALERFGYRVTLFESAATCLEALRADPRGYDALLTDQTMPGMAGIDLAAEVRGTNPDLLIVIMSGYFSRLSADKLTQLGRVELLAKPFTKEELACAMDRAFQANRGFVPPPGGPAG